MDTPSKPGFEFGSFRLDPSDRVLLRGRERLELPPRVFDTLLTLVQGGGRLVEKDELMQTVWPNTAVEENNLSQAIYLLRKILHDGENGTRYIETVPKRGYRFVARVHELKTEAEPGIGERSSPEQLESLNGNSGTNSRNNSKNNGSSQSPIQAPPKVRWFVWCMAGLVGAFVSLLAVQVWRWQDRKKISRIQPPSGPWPCCRYRTFPAIPRRNISPTE